MARAVEVQEDAVVEQSVAHHALAHARLVQSIDCLMLEDAGAHAALDVLATLGFQHHGIDAPQMQEMRQQQSRWAGADDRYLGTHEDPRVLREG